MFRRDWLCPNRPTGFPRIRGDVPQLVSYTVRHDLFSPHTRGCSVFDVFDHIPDRVFPAYAGMFRNAYHSLAEW